METKRIFVRMDLQAAKLDLVQKLLQVSNGTLIEKISKLLEKEMVVGYTVDGKPLTKAAYNKRLKKSRRAIQNRQIHNTARFGKRGR